MINLNRANFKSEMVHKGKTYECQIEESALNRPSHETAMCVRVMHHRLKGVMDLHGIPYKPSEFYYKLLK